MKKGRIATMVVVSLGLAYGAAWMANNWIQNRLAVKPAGEEPAAPAEAPAAPAAAASAKRAV